MQPALSAQSLSGLCRLSHWGVIRAQGEDSATFLHSQLSQDIKSLDASAARLAAFCTAKGRMLASMVVLRPAEHEIWLLCSADVLPATLKRLQMFVMRAKCKLSDATADLPLLGMAGSALAPDDAAAAAWSVSARDAARVVRLPDVPLAEGTPPAMLPRALWIGPAEALAPLEAAAPALPLPSWQWLEVKSGVATITQPVVEQFVPQMVNFELVGGVNFKKGCYPGQEVVARSQYLGKLKRRAVLVDGEVALQPGQEVFVTSDPAQPAGMVVNAAPMPGGQGYSALVEVKVAALETGALHLGKADGPLLKPATLPYPLPAEGSVAA